MDARIGAGLASPGAAPQALPSQDVRPATDTAVPAGMSAPRTAALSRPSVSRDVAFRDPPPAPADVPLADTLAAAADLCRSSMDAVISLFENAARNEPVPLSVAEQTVDRLLAFLDEEPDALLGLVRVKAHGDYAHMHSVAVSALMASLARELRLDQKQQRQAALGGLLHDIGKAFVSSRILGKPGKLTDDEFGVVRTHPRRGYDALATAEGLEDAVKDVAHHHHERPDGKGYPNRLAGRQISRLARMGAICDVYDAVTSNRPYKDGWDPAAAMQAMAQWAQGGQFDVAMTAAFKAMMGEWPIGSLVRLRSQRLAVVNAKTSRRAGRLSATAFFCVRTQRMLAPEVVDFGPAQPGDAIEALESNATWRFRELDRLWAGNVAQTIRAARVTAQLQRPPP